MEDDNTNALLSPEDAEAAAASANAYISEMPKHKQKIRKLLIVAFHPTTIDGERMSAFTQALKLMQKDNISFLEIMRADWGGGPLVAAISQVGHMTMTAGKYQGRNLAWIVQEDPAYIAQTVQQGWRAGALFEAIKLMHNAWMSELVCRFSGDWDDPTIRQWEEHGEDAAWGTRKGAVPST
jgi:uncharacterized protein (DUF3820 family)